MKPLLAILAGPILAVIPSHSRTPYSATWRTPHGATVTVSATSRSVFVLTTRTAIRATQIEDGGTVWITIPPQPEGGTIGVGASTSLSHGTFYNTGVPILDIPVDAPMDWDATSYP